MKAAQSAIPLDSAAKRHESTALHYFAEKHESYLAFNVMPGKPVEETLHVHGYAVGERYAEAHFDRSYSSSMQNSPSHLIFLSALVHTQKMLYLVLCEELGFDYDPHGPERFKMWPTKISVRIPELIEEEQGLVQRLWVRDFTKFNDSTYRARLETRVGSLVIECDCPVFVTGTTSEVAA